MGGRGGSSGLGANQRYTQKEQTVKNNVDLLVESYFKATGLTEGRLERKYEIMSTRKTMGQKERPISLQRKRKWLREFATCGTIDMANSSVG